MYIIFNKEEMWGIIFHLRLSLMILSDRQAYWGCRVTCPAHTVAWAHIHTHAYTHTLGPDLPCFLLHFPVWSSLRTKSGWEQMANICWTFDLSRSRIQVFQKTAMPAIIQWEMTIWMAVDQGCMRGNCDFEWNC